MVPVSHVTLRLRKVTRSLPSSSVRNLALIDLDAYASIRRWWPPDRCCCQLSPIDLDAYSMSRQIRTQADRMLGPEVSDVDGNKEDRKDTVSTFNSLPRTVTALDTPKDEIKAVNQRLTARANEGIVPHEIGVFARSAAKLDRARTAVEGAKLPYKVLDDGIGGTAPVSANVSVSPLSGLL